MKLSSHQVSALVIILLLCSAALVADEGRLLRFPDIHGDTIVFAHAGDLWTVPAAGGRAVRITTHEGVEQFPKFSPDGKWIAFTGQYSGDNQVYVIPTEGGEPKQLTYYPSKTSPERFGDDNMVYGWTPDGKVCFRSQRLTFDIFVGRLFVVDTEGGMPHPMPMPISGFASFSPDGKKLAYNRIMRDFRPWKRYKGGMAQNVWIFDLESYEVEQITDWPGTENFPMWIGSRIYFNSDRITDENGEESLGRLNLWYIDTEAGGEMIKVTNFTEYDVKFPGFDSKRIVFENGGYLYILDTSTNEAERVDVELNSDRILARPETVSVKERISSGDLARGAKRVLLTARGEVFSVPAENGEIRNLTNTPGVSEKLAVWSPDGKLIAYFSDESGEENIYIRDVETKLVSRLTDLEKGIFRDLVWSPDSKKLLFPDRENNLYYITLEDKNVVKIDSAEDGDITDATWSPDSKWIAYSKGNYETFFSSLYLYNLADNKVERVTDDLTSDTSPAFSPDGKYLFFVSARDFTPSIARGIEFDFTTSDLSRPYLLTLAPETPSPFLPKSDEVEVEKEEDGEKADEKKEEAPTDTRIELDGLGERVVGFPVKGGTYRNLVAGKNAIFYINDGALQGFDLEKQKEVKVLVKVQGFTLDPQREKILYRAGNVYGIIPAAVAEAKPNTGALKLDKFELTKNPELEWANSFNELWRRYRDGFYDKGMHGVDWPALRNLYKALVPFVSHRTDLTYVMSEMVSELGAGHCYVGGGDQPELKSPQTGLLGCTFADTGDGYYQFDTIYTGENWHDDLRSPLTEPGVNIKIGDYLIAIDGKEIKSSQNVFSHLVNKSDRIIEITVNDKPSKDGANTFKVKPISDETSLVYYNWVRKNREYVAEKTDGQVGYIHIPDMSQAGLKEFIKWFYAQLDKKALIVDIRYNGGGFVSEMILRRLLRQMAGMFSSRDGGPQTYPLQTFVGPKVCITNEYAASDGDIFGHFFKHYKLGRVIGKRSWGGVIGISGMPPLLDGGYAFVPGGGTFSLEGKWIIENIGVEPDIVIDNLPARVIAGFDDQLDKAIEIALEEMKTYSPWKEPTPREFPKP